LAAFPRRRAITERHPIVSRLARILSLFTGLVVALGVATPGPARSAQPDETVVVGHPETLRSVRVVAGVGGTAVVSVVVSAIGPVAALEVPPLPSCVGQDIVTVRVGYAQYATTLLDTRYRLPATYRPPDLMPTGLSGGGLIRRVAIADLRAMDRAARAAGARLGVTSAYRSYSRQVLIFKSEGSLAAAPGHSEHQLGTAIDFRAVGEDGLFRSTRAGSWMKANAWKYGWVMSYPAGKTSLTCYPPESWHFRYVGRAEARLIHGSGSTIRQWLWVRFGR
jgi:D-alanyl-D-alanine carboxypeptidase